MKFLSENLKYYRKYIEDGKLRFKNPFDDEQKIVIYNSNGEVVLEASLKEGLRTLDIAKLRKGEYIYIIGDKVGKFVIK